MGELIHLNRCKCGCEETELFFGPFGDCYAQCKKCKFEVEAENIYATVAEWNKKTQSLFKCDPNKNTKCKKTECFINGGDCRHTDKKEFSTELEERLIYKGVILGEPKTKKNKPKIIRIHGRPSIIPSDEYARFEADALRQMKRPEETIAKRIRVVGLFYRSTFRVVDLPNLENALDDILVAGGIIRMIHSNISIHMTAREYSEAVSIREQRF